MPPVAMSTLDETYATHLGQIAERHGQALEASGFAAGLWYSGFAPLQLEDDQNYPFKVNPPFKTWAPLVEVPDCFVYFEPGKQPLMLFHQPEVRE